MPLVFPPLYVIMDAALCGPKLLSLARELAQAGVELIQYRDKTGPARETLSTCQALVEELADRGVRLIVNDRVDIAVLSGAAGVHVGQEDLPVEAVRRICGPSFWVGLSTHNLAQLAAADREPVDYLAFGPIFPTRTKRTADPPVGIEGLARARAQTQRPLVAIGGITLETAPVLWQAGANAVAVAADILRAPDPAARAHAYLERARQWHRQHGLPRGPLR
jgi:thiamine-phosphate pyrophosphorylase